MQDVNYKYKDKQDLRMVLGALFALGLEYFGIEEQTLEVAVQHTLKRQDEYRYLCLDETAPHICLSRNESCCIPLNQFLEKAKLLSRMKPLKIRLNSEYTAEVYTDSVKVGCSTFSFEVIEELYTAVQQQKGA